MGLMKLSTYHKMLGDDVTFFKGEPLDFVRQEATKHLLDLLTHIQPEVDWIGKKKLLTNLFSRRRFMNSALKDYLSLPELSALSERAIDKSITSFKHKDYFQNPQWDRICITTLFTFYWEKTVQTINFFKQLCKDPNQVFVGGIAASVDPDEMFKDTGIKPSVGLLNKGGEYDDNDIIIDTLPLDYSILHETDYQYPEDHGYISYMTRGCVNNCAFCVVPRLEPTYISHLPLKGNLDYAKQHFGERKDLLLLDNNVFASKDFDAIIDEIKACGFEKGAKYSKPNFYEIAVKELQEGNNLKGNTRLVFKLYKELVKKLSATELNAVWPLVEQYHLLDMDYANTQVILKLHSVFKPFFDAHYRISKANRYVDFNQGMDARLATDEKMKKLSEIAIRPLRIAFDHWEIRDQYRNAISLAANHGINLFSNYMLYNFRDDPIDLYRRMNMNIELSKELSVTIYSFPMKYHPISDQDYFRNRDYIGAKWNRKFIRAIQLVLNATKGKVSTNPEFFYHAFGKDEEEFKKLLLMPEELIFHREKYENNGIQKQWWSDYCNLTETQRKVLLPIIYSNKFEQSVDDPVIDNVLEYYRKDSKHLSTKENDQRLFIPQLPVKNPKGRQRDIS